MNGMKVCRGCQVDLPVDQFKRNGTYRTKAGLRRGPSPYCRECWSFARVLKKFGLTSAEWYELRARQGGTCAICLVGVSASHGKRLGVDHDHATGQVRGLLCGACNTGIAAFKESTNIMLRAIQYLHQHRNQPQEVISG